MVAFHASSMSNRIWHLVSYRFYMSCPQFTAKFHTSHSQLSEYNLIKRNINLSRKFYDLSGAIVCNNLNGSLFLVSLVIKWHNCQSTSQLEIVVMQVLSHKWETQLFNPWWMPKTVSRWLACDECGRNDFNNNRTFMSIISITD